MERAEGRRRLGGAAPRQVRPGGAQAPLVLLLALVLTAPVAAQSPAPASGATKPSPATVSLPSPQEAAALPLDAVVASRGGATVTLGDIDARLAQMPADVRAGYMNSPERIEQLVRNMLVEAQLANAAREAGLHERRLFELQASQAVNRMLATQMLDHHVATMDPPDFRQLAYEAYLADASSFTVPEQIDLIQVLVMPEGDDRKAAREEAEAVRAKALDGVPFEQLVEEHNDGRPLDGRLSKVARGQMVPPFEEAAFALAEVGDVSPVVETQFGFHVIKLTARKDAVRAPFETVREALEKKAREQWIGRERRALRERLNSMEIEATPDVVAALRTRYQPEHSPIADYDEAVGPLQ